MQDLLETWLEPLSEAPFPMAVLNDFLKEYSHPGFKAHMMVKEGKLIRLKRGWFCVNPKYSKKSINHGVVANVLYDGPSYVSIETALSSPKRIGEKDIFSVIFYSCTRKDWLTKGLDNGYHGGLRKS